MQNNVKFTYDIETKPTSQERRASSRAGREKPPSSYRRQRRGTVVNPWGLDVELPVWNINNTNLATSSELFLLMKVGLNPPTMPPGRPDTVVNHGIKKKIRPSSASGKIQSHPSFYSSLFGGRPTTAGAGMRTPDPIQPQRPVTQAAGPRRTWKTQEEADEEEIRRAKQPRRLTLGAVDGISEMENLPRPGFGLTGIATQLKAKNEVYGDFQKEIEEQINIDTLEDIKEAFHDVDEDGSRELDLDEFKDLLKKRLNLKATKDSQIDSLFMKIDWSSDGAITWDEFCTYMQLEYAEKEDSYLRSKDVAFHLPAKIINHREAILRITDTSDGNFMACSVDGNVSFMGTGMEMKKQKSLINPDPTQKSKQKWITDFVIMAEFNKFIVGTGEREIQFYELSSLDPYCQIGGLETVPLKMDYCATGADECIVLYGDSYGCVNILVIASAGECLRTWKKQSKKDGIASVGLDQILKTQKIQLIRWQVHGDWVQQIAYYHDIGQVISCSNHANTALVIGCTTGSTHVEQQLKEIKENKDTLTIEEKARRATIAKPRLETDQSVFYVYKGVKCFDFSKDKNIIVTGGMDRIVRLWNPYVSGKPTALLRGHNAPIFYLFIASDENRIFSISTDKCVKVWDIQDHNCLLTVRPKGHKIHGELQACHYSCISKTLAVATDQKMSALNLKLRPVLHADITITHKEPVTSVKYNADFNQVITCSEGSVIKLWDFETGSAIFEFGEAHGDAAITCMTFDVTGRRLITGGRDGTLKIWNYNNGHCLRTLRRSAGGQENEVCDLIYGEMNKNRYVISVGWDRHINIYSDDNDADANISMVQYPSMQWADDLKNGHKEDILSIAQNPPKMIATGSYDGEIIVWNMVSGHIFCHLHAPKPPKYVDQALDGDMSINKLVFLKKRESEKSAASLIASGPRGHIHFWNVFQGGALMAQFKGSRSKGAMISTMTVDENNTKLFAGDSHGFVFIYCIEGYCLHESSMKSSPELLHSWRGHVDSVTALEIVEKNKVLMSASIDCTVRMWNFDGDYIGTYGQPDPWDLFDESSFQHPMVPYDVLIDPLSLPPKSADDDMVTPDLAREESNIGETEKVTLRTPTPQVTGTKNQFYVDDETIAKQLQDLATTLKDEHLSEEDVNKLRGKWLRHEKTKIKPIDRGGPNEYHMLKWSPLKDTPTPTLPKHKFNKDDPLNFAVS